VTQEANPLLALEKKKIEENPVLLAKNSYLTIRVKEPKAGEGFIQALNPTPTQIRFYNFLNNLIKENILPRIWWLKARQIKGTTWSMATVYARNSQKGGRTAFIVGDDLDGAYYIFSMAKLFQEYLERDYPHLAPKVKYSTRKELVFGELKTNIFVDTANNVALGQKYCVHDAIFSECSKYPAHAREMFIGFLQAMPRHMDTLFIGESTANGIGGLFYEEVMKAYQRRSDWQLFFTSFLEEPEYRIKIDDKERKFIEDTIDEEEEGLIKIHNAELEQLYWRRHCIINYCAGINEEWAQAQGMYKPRKTKLSIDNFHQYYPVTVPQAFIASGNCKFDTDVLSDWMSNAPKLAQKGEPLYPGHNYLEGYFFDNQDGFIEFIEQTGGPWKIFEWPEKGIDYCDGFDVAEGLEEEGTKEWDYSTAEFFRRDNMNQVAEYRAHIEPDLFAYEAWKGLIFYGSPMAVPEANKDGNTMIKFLREKYNYMNFFVRKVIEAEKYRPREMKRLGWLTTAKSKADMVNYMQWLIREQYIRFYSTALIAEALSFVQKPDGKTEAQAGCFDDLIIAACIAAYTEKDIPKPEAWKQRAHMKR